MLNCSFTHLAYALLSPVRSPIIVTIWKVVFANKSCMDFRETWQVGLRPEKTKPCTFLAKSRYGFRREREKMGRTGVVFLSRVRLSTSATFLRSISAKLSKNTCPGGVS